MTQYLVAIHHPNDYDPAVSEDAAMDHDIDVLNDEMRAAGAIVFVGGLEPTGSAVSVRARNGALVVTDGPYMETKEHIGGFLVVGMGALGAPPPRGRQNALAPPGPGRGGPFSSPPP